MFGGQVVGQALTAAFNTVREPLLLHSLHCYFLKGGKDVSDALLLSAWDVKGLGESQHNVL